jgi:hypothetical protein
MFLSKPEPLSILLCDGIAIDPNTRRKCLLGVYPHVVAEAFPLTLTQVWLFVCFTGAQGMLTLTVRVLDGERVLFEAGGRATCGDVGSTYEMTVPVTGLTFARPGVYVIEALADGVAFARRKLRVIAASPAPVPDLAPSAS